MHLQVQAPKNSSHCPPGYLRAIRRVSKTDTSADGVAIDRTPAYDTLEMDNDQQCTAATI